MTKFAYGKNVNKILSCHSLIPKHYYYYCIFLIPGTAFLGIIKLDSGTANLQDPMELS